MSATATICQLLQTEQVRAAAPANESATFLIGLPLRVSGVDMNKSKFVEGFRLFQCISNQSNQSNLSNQASILGHINLMLVK